MCDDGKDCRRPRQRNQRKFGKSRPDGVRDADAPVPSSSVAVDAVRWSAARVPSNVWWSVAGRQCRSFDRIVNVSNIYVCGGSCARAKGYARIDVVLLLGSCRVMLAEAPLAVDFAGWSVVLSSEYPWKVHANATAAERSEQRRFCSFFPVARENSWNVRATHPKAQSACRLRRHQLEYERFRITFILII